MKWTVCEKSCWLADNPLAIAECAALRISVSGHPDRTATWSQAATDNNSPAHVTHHRLLLLRTPVKRHGR
jgi:hypothetical protein